MRARGVTAVALAVLLHSSSAAAGPETALREFASGQIKKGVRTIGMGGDGATTGNYALVYRDAGGALFDEGVVRFRDTGNLFTFSAVGFTTPTFWEDAAFYVIALGQQGTDVRVWNYVPTRFIRLRTATSRTRRCSSSSPSHIAEPSAWASWARTSSPRPHRNRTAARPRAATGRPTCLREASERTGTPTRAGKPACARYSATTVRLERKPGRRR